MTIEEVRAYAEKLAQEAALDETQKAAFMQALANEKIAKGFADGTMRQDEFSRQMDQIREKEKAREAQMATMQQNYGTWEQWYKQNEPRLKQLARYEQTYGPLDDGGAGNGNAAAAAQMGMTKDEFEKLLNERLSARDSAYSGVIKSMGKLVGDHYHRFKEPLDVDGLEKFAVDNGVPLETAYERLIAPKVEAQRKAEVDALVKAKYDEGVRDGMTRARTTGDSRPRDASFSSVLDQKDELRNLNPRDREKTAEAAFFKGMDDWAAQKQGTQS